MSAVMSEEMKTYFEGLEREAERCYTIAERARKIGGDPEGHVEIPRAEDLASRVEKLLAKWKLDGIAQDIRDLTAEYEKREIVSLKIAEKVAREKGWSKAESLDRAVRAGLAVLTEGILVAPLEGISKVEIGKNLDGTDYADIYFSGPIRSAGGTGQAMSVLIADVVRRELKIGEYKPTKAEVERYQEEIPLYNQKSHLQYAPSAEEIRQIVENCPVCINGDGTEKYEVSGHRDLPRVKENRVRGGMCLVVAEGMCQKAAKIEKHVDALEIKGWEFLDYFTKKTSGAGEGKTEIKPSSKYIRDILAGRPVLSHPSKAGGFRLRYGRGRNTGLAAVGINPASMEMLDGFIAIGTQIKLERPGKAGAVGPCDSIEGPIVLLKNGTVKQVNTVEEAAAVRGSVKEILDLGEILISSGEFAENNHVFVPGAYAPEWHRLELEDAVTRAGQKMPEDWEHPDFSRAVEMSENFGVPLHPDYNLFWHDLTPDDIHKLRNYITSEGKIEEGRLVLPLPPSSEQEMGPGIKRILELLAVFHRIRKEDDDRLIMVSEKHSPALLYSLGLKEKKGKLVDRKKLPKNWKNMGALELVNELAGIKIMARGPTRIGSRMARPEKAALRKMNPPPHVLFPIGEAGGNQRLLKKAINTRKNTTIEDSLGSQAPTVREDGILVDLCQRRCPKCGKITFLGVCPDCGVRTEPDERLAPRKQQVLLGPLYKMALENLGLGEEKVPDIKAVKGLIPDSKIPEPIEKGILRAMHGVFPYKDGTMRYDMTDMTLTHFRPDEIGITVEKARELGYTHDVYGRVLESGEQVCELRLQDILIPRDSAEYLMRAADFIDDLLVRYYKQKAYYNIKSKEELIGQMVIGIAPHTSGGVLARIIGFTDAFVGYGHPFFHAAKRRNCDGDEDAIILLMDALLNFSRAFLPNRSGGLMDAPLVLTTRIDPAEIDKEAHNIDTDFSYSLDFYRATLEYARPKEVKEVDRVSDRVGTEAQYEGFGFTHDTRDISEGVKISAYKSLGSMSDKLIAQLELARRIRAVDTADVAQRVINTHFMPDMIGNLKAFSNQKFRCTKCGKSYRRMPLTGKCECGNNLILTVPKKNVIKYLEVARRLANDYELPDYTKERINLIEEAADSLFHSDKEKNITLENFM